MKYQIVFNKKADKQLRKIDLTQQRIIVNWIEKNLENTDSPKNFAKTLKGNLKDYYRYRVGDYRIIAEINNDEIIIIIINIGHRKDILKKNI